MRHLISLTDITPAQVLEIFDLAATIKADFARGVRKPLLPGRVLALLFEKPSLRTRCSFESGMIHLGGGTMFLGNDVGFNTGRESIADFGRVLSQFVDVVVVRAKSHKTVTDLAGHFSGSVINGLTDHDHPCQALADIFTLRELLGDTRGKQVTFVGDANNVSRSLMQLCAFLDMPFRMATPVGYRFDDEEVAALKRTYPRFDYAVTDDPIAAVRGASAVYTDVWTSMGQEAESAKRIADFGAYQVNAALMQHAPQAYFLHCLPAQRGLEVTDEVMDGPQSKVVEQAGNRMHVQKAVLVWLLNQ